MSRKTDRREGHRQLNKTPIPEAMRLTRMQPGSRKVGCVMNACTEMWRDIAKPVENVLTLQVQMGIRVVKP